MSVTTYLNGKVVKRTLPAIQGPVPPEAPLLKRLRLGQGELAQITEGTAGMHYLAFLEFRAGTIRGNHYHKVKEEWVYVGTGELALEVQDIHTQARETVILRAGDLATIYPEVAHAMRVTAAGYGVEFSPGRFDPADLYKVALI